MKRTGYLLILISFFHATSYSQTSKTWNPATDGLTHLEGQAWPEESAPYTRFPKRAEQSVSKNVWQLSRNSAGISIRFKTNAHRIVVRYTVEDDHAFPHMPATGVSGLDLYGVDRDGKWLWFPGKYSFKDTLSYTFNGLLSRRDSSGRNYEYKLYLPLYNTVKWLEISYPDTALLEPMPARVEKPIVVYGTSIAQGGCAGRPGLAWTAILERNMDRPLINLGFSGNGLLDSSVIHLMTELDAKLYILDCLPNLISQAHFPDDDVTNRILNAVRILKLKKPGVPIVLSEHSAGGPNNGMRLPVDNVYEHANNLLRKAFAKMQMDGIKNIFLLSNSDINFSMHSTVDGEHPNDLGMEQNAAAYEKLIRKVLHESVDSGVTTTPIAQSRDNFYFMPDRHREILLYNKEHKPRVAFIGNSIVHMWGGNPKSSIVNGNNSWNKLFEPLNTVNMGFGWDRIENVLWRVYHDELDGFDAEKIVIMIGTNNVGLNTDEEILKGLEKLYKEIIYRQPKAKLYIVGILPRRNTEPKINALNRRISQIAKSVNAIYSDAGKVLLKKDGTIDESLFTDGLHPNDAGYEKLAGRIEGVLK